MYCSSSIQNAQQLLHAHQEYTVDVTGASRVHNRYSRRIKNREQLFQAHQEYTAAVSGASTVHSSCPGRIKSRIKNWVRIPEQKVKELQQQEYSISKLIKIKPNWIKPN
jgi:hypothetical protein